MTRRKNERLTPEYGQKSTAADVREILSKALINYLWGLISKSEFQDGEAQLLVLEESRLGGRNMQSIYHLTGPEVPIDARRVYGVEPVNCGLRVLRSENIYKMSLWES